MKRIVHLIVLLSAPLAFGQSTTSTLLDQNNISTEIADGGVYFNRISDNQHGYEVPSGSGKHAMYSLSYWFGALDVISDLKIAAPTYDSQSDIFPGPLTQNTLQPANWPSSVFPITRDEINAHAANYMNPGYVTPASILNWPAHGDVSLGFDYYLAPFYDFDSNGSYEPSAGDYPCILGDKAVYVITNDNGGVHATGGDALGIEIHTLFYQFNMGNDLNDATFAHVKVINRSVEAYQDFRMTIFADADLGNFLDDYMGTDPSRNMMFTYSGDQYDEDFSGMLGYGDHPPAIAVKSLDRTLASSGPFRPAATPVEYWNLMHGLDPTTGLNWTSPIGLFTNFIYPGDPTDSTEYSEVNQSNVPGDRRMIYTITENELLPGGTFEHDYVVLFSGADTNNLTNVTNLYAIADEAQAFYDTNLQDQCAEAGALSIPSIEPLSFQLFPNPTSGKFTIRLDEKMAGSMLSISTLAGKIILTKEISEMNHEITLDLDAPTGIYFVKIENEQSQHVQKLILGTP